MTEFSDYFRTISVNSVMLAMYGTFLQLTKSLFGSGTKLSPNTYNLGLFKIRVNRHLLNK